MIIHFEWALSYVACGCGYVTYVCVYVYYSVFEGELAEAIPVVHATIGGCRIVGTMCAGTCIIITV